MSTTLRLPACATTTRRSLRSRLMLQALEARDVPATFTVTNTSDGTVAAAGDLPGSLRQAIFDANATGGLDSIAFDKTAFAGTATITLAGTELSITDPVTITGTGAANLTISASAKSLSRVLRVATGSSTVTTTISGLTLTGGRLPSSGTTTFNGAGILLDSGRLTLTADLITYNSASGDGGGIYVGTAAINFDHSTVSHNASGHDGGGIALANCSLPVVMSAGYVFENTAKRNGGGISGSSVIFSSERSAGSSRTLIYGNESAEGDGGGAFLSASTVTFADTAIGANSTTLGSGGGIYQSGGTLVITDESVVGGSLEYYDPTNNVSFLGNQAKVNGGGICVSSGVLSVLALGADPMVPSPAKIGNTYYPGSGLSYSYGNTASGTGGGIFSDGPVTLDTASVECNLANAGGGVAIATSAGYLTCIDSVNFQYNIAATFGGGLLLDHVMVSSVTFTAISGTIQNNEAPSGGAGIELVGGGSVTVNKAAFTANLTTGSGGEGGDVLVQDFSDASSSLNVISSSFSASTATFGGGLAVITSTGPVTVDSTTFAASVASDSGSVSGNGGAIYLSDATSVTINASTIKTSSAIEMGGGVFISGNSKTSKKVIITDSTITQNSATNGAGLYLSSTNVAVSMNTTSITSNAASKSGGGLTASASTIGVNGCTLAYNSANSGTGQGGACFLASNGSMTAVNSTVANNAAGQGGGIAIQEATTGSNVVRFYNSTIAYNDSTLSSGSTGGGGGIWYSENSNSHSILLDSTIVAKNTSTNTGPDIYGATGEVNALFSLIGYGDTGFTLKSGSMENVLGTFKSPRDPDFDGGLGGNGGPTETILIKKSSPALDHGRNFLMMTTEQRGGAYARRAGVRTDIGAVEANATPTAVVVIDDDTVQRSMVQYIYVHFTTSVTLPTDLNDAFKLTTVPTAAHPGTATAVGLSFTTSGTDVTISFNDATYATPVGTKQSLVDGVYEFRIVASAITMTSGAFDGNGDGTTGDDFVTQNYLGNGIQVDGELHRLYGDRNGDAQTTLSDYVAFMAAYGNPSNPFDYDGNSVVDLADYVQFRARYGFVL